MTKKISQRAEDGLRPHLHFHVSNRCWRPQKEKNRKPKGNGTRFLESRSRFQLQFICISLEKVLKISWWVILLQALHLNCICLHQFPFKGLSWAKLGLDHTWMGNSLGTTSEKPKAGSIAVACEPSRWAASSFKAHRLRESLGCVLDSLLETALLATWMGLAVWCHENGQI